MTKSLLEKQIELSNMVIEAGKFLIKSNLVARTWGNISCRLPLSNNFIITPSGRAYENLQPEDLCLLNADCKSLEFLNCNGLKPSSEKKLHSIIYQKRSDINFIIHTHQPFASAMSLAGEASSGYPTAKYALPGTDELANYVGNKIATDTDVILMHGHGTVILGNDYRSAMELSLKLERECRAAFLADYFPTGITDGSIDFSTEQIHVSKDKRIKVKSPIVDLFSKQLLPAYIDDFSQIFGSEVEIDNSSFYFSNTDIEEIQAAALVVYKNCLGAVVAQQSGEMPISIADCNLMHNKYVNSYSKEMFSE